MAFQGFKKVSTVAKIYDTPEMLLHDLRAKKIQGPLSHQADMWRKYQDEALDKKDVALELPTGSGKTLVGLILGEWRRQRFREKVLYLCPTNQLVHQVAEQAEKKYGIKVAKFVGSSREYPATTKADYLETEKIAVTSYSALFNTNPFFSNPDIIIFDDAHASENYISSLWSLSIGRYKNEEHAAYCAITGLLKPYLSAVDYQKMTEDYGDSEWVDKLPNSVLAEIYDDLVSILNAYCTEGTSMQYAWGSIKNNLLACHFYISSSGVLVRPLISPTQTHRPFAEAKQRIYMSATLGRGGDLERLVGVKKIFRLPIPDGWEKQGIGRRFYIFPERSIDDPKAINAFILEAIKMYGRSVILTRNEDAAKDYEKMIKTSLGYPVFHARDIEESKNVFLNEKNAVAIMANRYDGVDFAEEESRMLLIDDLPTSTNLQERFFVSRMAANALLNERILTRVIQAMGRCTRSSTDYSAVIVAGERLVGYLLQQKTRSLLHPELQAELQFGIEQSKDVDVSTLLSYLEVFLKHDSNWFGADEEIMSLRDGLTQSDPSYLLNLEQSVEHEVEYQYKLWSGDFLSAANEAKAVLDLLTDSDLRGYRALWNYLVGSAYMKSGAQYRATAKEYFEVAMRGAPSLSWLVKLAKMTFDGEPITAYSDDIGVTIDNFEQKIIKLGLTSNRKYDAFEKSIYEGLRGDAKQFESAQKNLGELIGYRAGKIEDDGSPDPWWQLSEKLFIVFEDFTDAKTTTELCTTKARQSATHDNWLIEKFALSSDVEIIKVLVTSVKKAKDGALPHLKDVYLWERDKFIEWALKILPILRELRMNFGSEGDMSWRANAAEIYHKSGLSIADMSTMVKRINAYQYFSGKLDI